METDKVLKELGLGLSLLLRYSYGGFLLIVLASIVNPTAAGKVLNSMPWELAGLSALVLGAGIYALHRSVVIPAHHYGLCVALWIKDVFHGVKPAKSYSPTRWLGSIGVKWGNRIVTYTALRRSDFFGAKKKMIDLAHAESGLVVNDVRRVLYSRVVCQISAASLKCKVPSSIYSRSNLLCCLIPVRMGAAPDRVPANAPSRTTSGGNTSAGRVPRKKR